MKQNEIALINLKFLQHCLQGGGEFPDRNQTILAICEVIEKLVSDEIKQQISDVCCCITVLCGMDTDRHSTIVTLQDLHNKVANAIEMIEAQIEVEMRLP